MGFSGSTAECLVEFGERYPEVAGRKLLAQFAKVVESPTARDWVAGNQPPKGESLLRVRCFLYLAGFDVSEFEELPGIARQLALLVATDIMTMDEVQQDLDYKDRGGVFDIVLRGRSPMRDKIYRMERLVNNHGDDLKREIADWKHRLGSLALVPAEDAEKAEVTDNPPTVPEKEEPAIDLPPQPAKQVSHARKRKRARTARRQAVRDSAGIPANVRTANVLMHMVQSMDEILEGVDDQGRSDLAALLQSRISARRTDAIIDFLRDVRRGDG